MLLKMRLFIGCGFKSNILLSCLLLRNKNSRVYSALHTVSVYSLFIYVTIMIYNLDSYDYNSEGKLEIVKM